jgi:hypothetical protein
MPESRARGRTRTFIRWVPPIVMVTEIVLIVLQAARGTTSHFNAAALWLAIMGGLLALALGGQPLLAL